MLFFKDDQNVYRLRPFEAVPWLVHGFGTSHSANWPPPGPLTTLRQIHSNIVVRVSEPVDGRIAEGDALITDHPGSLLGIRTADCVPVLILDPVHRAVAAVHAGWRGTVASIVCETVRKMKSQFGSQTSDLLAAIGPCIGSCCFEVGPEVAVQFQSFWPERQDLQASTRIDLAETNRRQLTSAGLQADHVFRAGLCTCCAPAEFHSYRRDRGTGRLVNTIGILEHPTMIAL